MDRPDPQPDIPAPAARLAATLAVWGGIAALGAIAIGGARGEAFSSALGVAPVLVAAGASFALLRLIGPRPLARWGMPLLLVQIVRTGLAPMLGLALFLLVPSEAIGFWMSLLGVAGVMLIGETVAISRMFGSPGVAGSPLTEAAA
jgi:hypothetical protein